MGTGATPVGASGNPAPIPTVDAVIAAAGQWVKAFNVNSEAATAPDIFGHLFIRAIHTGGEVYQTAGTIMTGEKWDRSTSPFWKVVHGHTDSSVRMVAENLSFLTYLGPVWRAEYAKLSDAVFRKLGAQPLKNFLQHP